MKPRLILPAAILTMLFGIIGCAQDVGDINRVQPNFVRKVDLEGEWYLRQTIADVGPMGDLATSFYTVTGWTYDTEKIRWEITEDMLIAYRTHERYPGLNPIVDRDNEEIGNTPVVDGVDDGHESDTYKDAPVAAYRIARHFDIQRQYNPATGEQTNVIVENTADRPWREREYMRVDWSKNMITHLTGDALQSYFTVSDICPSFLDFAQYIPADLDSDWMFKMERQDEDGEWTPHRWDPTEPEFVADLRPDYIDFTQRIFSQPPKIGWRTRDGRTVCIAACYLLSGTHDCTSSEIKVRTSILRVPEERTFEPRVYDQHDQLKFGFFRTERKIVDRYEGETDPGMLRFANIYDIWETAYDEDGEVLPYNQRQPRPIVFALSKGFPEELIEVAEFSASEWSRAFARAVAGAQRRSLESVQAEFPTHDEDGNYINQGMFRLNYNRDGRALIGDLRHSFIYWVDSPHLFEPLGYGPLSPDPETGEVIAGSAYIYGAPFDRQARTVMKVVDALLGNYTLDEITDGQDVRDLLEDYMDSRIDPRASGSLFGLGSNRYARDRLEGELGNLTIEDLRIENLDPRKRQRLELLQEVGFEHPTFTSKEERMGRLKDTPFETMMVNSEIRAALPSLDLAQSSMNSSVIDAARPYTTEIFENMAMQRMREDWALANNLTFSDFFDSQVFALAQFLKERMEQDGWSYMDAQEYVRQQQVAATLIHEIGHVVGLRHNFQGAFDSINYRPEYWDMRRENLVANPVTLDHLEHMSTLTEAQIEGGMEGYQYASIMDYHGGWTNDGHGLGRYDEAAIMYGYGEAVEVFEEAGQRFRSRYFETTPAGFSRFEARGSPAYPHLLETTHYTRIPYMLGDGDLDRGLERLQNRRVMPYETVRAMRDPDHPEHANRWVEVPYMFCTDHERGTHASCNRWVHGADVWEMTRNIINTWESYYWFSNFRRERWGWHPSRVLWRSWHYFSYFPNFYQHWLWNEYIEEVVDDPVQSFYLQAGSIEGFNFLGKVMATPPYGSYELDPVNNTFESISYGDVSGADLFIPRGPGRRPSSTYDGQSGHEFHLYQLEAGHYWDFLGALLAIIEGSARVLGEDMDSDFASYWIPYTLVFQEEAERLFHGIYIRDFRDFAPRLIDGEMVHRPLWDMYGEFSDDEYFMDEAPVVAPVHTSSFRFYALIYGMIGYTSALDMDYAERARIFRMGTGETHEVAEGFEIETFENPFNGVVYGAIHKPGERPGAGVQMIRKVNELKAEWELGNISQWVLTSMVDYMELQMSLSQWFGRFI